MKLYWDYRDYQEKITRQWIYFVPAILALIAVKFLFFPSRLSFFVCIFLPVLIFSFPARNKTRLLMKPDKVYGKKLFFFRIASLLYLLGLAALWFFPGRDDLIIAVSLCCFVSGAILSGVALVLK